MPERTAARHGTPCCAAEPPARKYRAMEEKRVTCSQRVASSSSGAYSQLWTALPQDLSIFVCLLLGHRGVLNLLPVNRKTRDLARLQEVWSFFCQHRWGKSANIGVYGSAKDLFFDSNGWFPRREGISEKPSFEIKHIRLHHQPCLTMDMRMTDDEIIAVSEVPLVEEEAGQSQPHRNELQQANVQVLDASTGQLKERFEVSESTINCCDVGPNLICLGSDDSKIRIYSRSNASSSGSGGSRYRASDVFPCSSEINDLRYAREGFVIAVKTHQNRHPAGLDVINLERPDAWKCFPGGSRVTRGKYIHAIDGFEEGCSLNCVACSGEHPLTSAFSAMLFDFRLPLPCVCDLPVVSQGNFPGTMLWPLRAGRDLKVFANLFPENPAYRKAQGTVAMVDFRFASRLDLQNDDSVVHYHLPGPVDDFRCFGGNIYAACSTLDGQQQRLDILRCNLDQSVTEQEPECLCTVVEAYDAATRIPREDLKVFSVCQRGFVASYGDFLALGTITEPKLSFNNHLMP